MADAPRPLADRIRHDHGNTTAMGAQQAEMQCCCGRQDCVVLKHNCVVLDTVEKDVHTAAKMGQALLARHEAYMASAERDRLELASRIEQLDMDKKQLEAYNARTIEENRTLLDQLEVLNANVADSDTRIRVLEATLQASRQTVRRLEGAAARATDMERHIAALEMEQLTLQNTLTNTQSEARSAMQRWRKAERGLADLQEQLDKMEKEAREEQERHADVVERLERQRAMERDLNTAAGRLKGAAAAKNIGDGTGTRSAVVSHFVRDLLQDNANLQIGIVELRGMLMNSEDEIQSLREQLLYHQPARDSTSGAGSTLLAELEPSEQPLATSASQQLHIHHHYHVTNRTEAKKPRKKRQSMASGVFTPVHGPASPSTPSRLQWQQPQIAQAPPARNLLTHSARDSVSTVSMPSNRWSLFSDPPSDFAPSSVPSSPQSIPREQGFVDPSSIPGTPVAFQDAVPPPWRRGEKSPLAPPALAHGIPTSPQRVEPRAILSTPSRPLLSTINSDGFEDETGRMIPLLPPTHDDAADQDVTPPGSPTPRPTLHRALSHESIMSLSNGMDIHTLKARPSQLSLRPLGATPAGTGLSAITARPTMSRAAATAEGKRGSMILRDSLGAADTGLGLPAPRLREPSRAVSVSAHLSSYGITPARQRDISSGAATGTLGRLVSWRPWATPATPQSGSPVHTIDTDTRTRSSTPLPAQLSTPTPTSTSAAQAGNLGAARSATTTPPVVSLMTARPLLSAASAGTPPREPQNNAKDPQAEWEAALGRAPGINQPGAVPIPGFYEYWAAHQRRAAALSRVHLAPGDVDAEALREGLEDA